jgi:formylglycine-generating enzyme
MAQERDREPGKEMRQMAFGCCPSSGPKGPTSKPARPIGGQYCGETVDIPVGTAFIGTDAPEIPMDSEGPLRRVKLKPFRMAATAVTNAEFAGFIAASGFMTEAERFGWSFVFWMQVPESVGPTDGVAEAGWWRRVDGATWAAPNGPGTENSCHPDHPVVQVSWNDARAYAAWVGGRLPTEAEWEHAARGGLGDVRFPWGQVEPDDTQTLPCNIWQGRFPDVNTAADGYVTTAPARAFQPNGYGLFNMVGNVWEWAAEPYKLRSMRREARAHMAARKGYKLLKGGSYLCHRSYCYRYRIAARIGNSPDSATTHQGFRVAFDA